LLLIDEVVEEGEYHEEALEAARDDWLSKQLDSLEIKTQRENDSSTEDSAISWAQIDCSKIAYESNKPDIGDV
jgi:hypothetical protein